MTKAVTLLNKYFPKLTEEQHYHFHQLYVLYKFWNANINVISRKDIDHLYLRHILHSLSIAKVIQFKPHTKIMDVGTGGGLPGIPLAIFFPQVHFHLVDSIGKKIKVVKEVADALKLKNISFEQQRAELVKEKFDFVVSRAVAPLKTLHDWTEHLILPKSFNDLRNGMICLKGGKLEKEIAELGKPVQLFPISSFFEEEFFKEKFVLYVPLN